MVRRGTLISTIDGQKPVETLTKGDRLLSYDISIGSLCFRPLAFLSKLRERGRVAVVDGLYLAKVSCVIDHENDEEVLIDPSGVFEHPKAHNLVVVGPDLKPRKADVAYESCDDDFFSIMPEETDLYFANGIMMSNGGSMTYTKTPYAFMTEDPAYRRDYLPAPDDGLSSIFAKVGLSADLVNKTVLRRIQGSLEFVKQLPDEELRNWYLRRTNVLVSNTICGERIVCG